MDYDAGTVQPPPPPPPVTPEITIPGGSGITEGGSASFTISANPAPAGSITVNIGVSESGSFGASGPATITVSGASATYTVTTSNDNLDEPNGSVTATVQSGTGYTVGTPSTASVNVADDDNPAPPAYSHTCQPGKTGSNHSLTDTPLTITESNGVRTLRIPENGKYVCLDLPNPGGAGRAAWKDDVFVHSGATMLKVEWNGDKISFLYVRFLDDNGHTGDRTSTAKTIAGGSKQWQVVIVDDETGVTPPPPPPPPPPATPVITISGGSGITEGDSATFTISASRRLPVRSR